MSNCLFDTSTCIFHLSFWRHGSEELRARGAAEFCMSRAKQKMATAFSLAFSREKNLLSAAMLSFSACCTLPFGFLTLVGTPLSIQEFMIPNKFPKTNPLQSHCKTDSEMTKNPVFNIPPDLLAILQHISYSITPTFSVLRILTPSPPTVASPPNPHILC